MKRMDITNFIHARKVHIFDLLGFADEDSRTAVPCRIKIAPEESLAAFVEPDCFVLDYVAEENGQIVTLANYPVPYEWAEDNTMLFDVCQFLKDRGHDPSSRLYRFNSFYSQTLFGSHTLLTTPYGGAQSLINWSGDAYLYSYLYFTPGTLTIDGQNVSAISWETASESSGAGSDILFPLVEQLLEQPHALTSKQIIRRIKKLELTYITCLWIHTDAGTCSLYNIYGEESYVDRRGQADERLILEGLSSTELLETGLKLMTCANVKGTVTRMCNQGRLKRAED